MSITGIFIFSRNFLIFIRFASDCISPLTSFNPTKEFSSSISDLIIFSCSSLSAFSLSFRRFFTARNCSFAWRSSCSLRSFSILISSSTRLKKASLSRLRSSCFCSSLNACCLVSAIALPVFLFFSFSSTGVMLFSKTAFVSFISCFLLFLTAFFFFPGLCCILFCFLIPWLLSLPVLLPASSFTAAFAAAFSLFSLNQPASHFMLPDEIFAFINSACSPASLSIIKSLIFS